MTSAPAPDHYSYSHYADPATARTFDDRRFGGPIGDLVAATQAQVLADFIGRIQQRDILDVGTGTGRAALYLARAGARVTAVDASEAMLEVARARANAENTAVHFQVGDAHALDFTDKSFDVVVCLRVLMHTPRWRTCVAELCRVAGRLVVVDYPAALSFALLESAARRVMIHGAVVRSPHAHARIVSIDTSAAEAAPGVKAVITGEDIPETNAKLMLGEGAIDLHDIGDNAMAHAKVLYHGHSVAAVAAVTPQAARDAAALIKVVYDVLEPVTSVDRAMAPDAPILDDTMTTKGQPGANAPTNVAQRMGTFDVQPIGSSSRSIAAPVALTTTRARMSSSLPPSVSRAPRPTTRWPSRTTLTASTWLTATAP